MTSEKLKQRNYAKQRQNRTSRKSAIPSSKQDSGHDSSQDSSSAGRDVFHWDIWLVLALQNWVFDFGRPIAALFVPLGWSPLNKPSVGDYFHMIYNIITPFCLLKLVSRSGGRVPGWLGLVLVLVLEMGASLHLVGDSVNHRLQHLGYLNHLPLNDNPLIKQLQPREMVSMFELLYLYDEQIGHYMWYIPFFLTLFLFYTGCFLPPGQVQKSRPLHWWTILLISALYYWYLVTEGQIFPLFLAFYVALTAHAAWNRRVHDLHLDLNGSFLLVTFTLTFALAVGWAWWLRNDVTLREKYPGWLYMPEPWAYYTLYLSR